MSLINQMLKDLEEQQGQHAAKSARLLNGLRSTESSETASNVWFIIAIALIIMLCGLAIGIFVFGLAKHPAAPQKNLSTIAPPRHQVDKRASPRKTKPILRNIPEQKINRQSAKSTQKLTIQASTIPAVKLNAVKKVTKVATIKKVYQPWTPDEWANLQYQKAIDLANQAEYPAAITILKHVIVKAPDFNPARESLAVFLIQQGKVAKAIALLRTGLLGEPDNAAFAKLLARLYMQKGNIPLAINTLLPAAPAINKDPDYHAFLAGLYEQNGQPLLAARVYNQLVHLVPTQGVWWMGLGISLEQLHKNNEAVIAYNSALNTRALNPELQAYVDSRITALRG